MYKIGLSDSRTCTALNTVGRRSCTHLLPARELELGPPQRLDHLRLVLVASPHGDERLTDAHARHGALGLSESAAHPSLQPGDENVRIFKSRSFCVVLFATDRTNRKQNTFKAETCRVCARSMAFSSIKTKLST